MASLEKRLDALEQAAAPRRTVVVAMIGDDWQKLTEPERAAKLAAARQQAGPRGTVICIEYVDEW